MRKAKYIINGIKNMDFSSFLETANEIQELTKKNKILIIIDMINCVLKYQSGYIDYKLFEMYNMNKHQRKTVVTRGINNSYVVKYNDPKFIKNFNNKIEFNKIFNDYLNRDWIELTNETELEKFIKKHQKIVVKPINLECGKGVELIDTKGKNIHELFEKLKLNNQFLIEEVSTQIQELQDIHPSSINTIRVVTLLGEILVAFIRIGNDKKNVDNFNQGGILAPINVETGKIEYQAIDKTGKLYTTHPLTNKPITGITIPKWEEIKELCEKVSLEVPQIGYVGWDICIGNDKCAIIEGNEFPGHDLYGLPPHRTNNIGLLPKFKEIEKRKKQ